MARRRLNLELLTCASKGHALPDLVDLDARTAPQLVRRTGDGLCWRRCLRCDAWLPSIDGHPTDRAEDGASGKRPSSLVVPERGRALRDRYVLRLIALDRLLHFLLLGTASVVVLLFTADRAHLARPFYRVVDALQNGVGGVGARPGTGVAGNWRRRSR